MIIVRGELEMAQLDTTSPRYRRFTLYFNGLPPVPRKFERAHVQGDDTIDNTPMRQRLMDSFSGQAPTPKRIVAKVPPKEKPEAQWSSLDRSFVD